MKTIYYKFLAICLLLLPQVACKKLVAVDPPVTSTTGVDAFNSDATASAVLTGIYTNLSAGSFATGGNDISILAGLSSDELSLFNDGSNPTYSVYYSNVLTNSSFSFWDAIYPTVFVINSAIEGVSSTKSLTPAVQQQLLGEAKFMRAFCYFYLVNFYGDVPLVTGTNYQVNAILPRTPKAQVWEQIIADLQSAASLLSPNYLDATLLNTTSERVRPTQGAANALLARAYLYTGDWVDAQAQASQVINNSGTYNLVSNLDSVFLANSNEAIWQLQPVNAGHNTEDALIFILPASGPGDAFPLYLDSLLVNTFEPDDQRRVLWVDSVIVNGTSFYFPYKYENNNIGAPVTEYLMVLRLAEQYLIRAEAEAQGAQGGTNAAILDLDAIRSRAGLPNYAGGTDQQSVLNAIYHERQVELFTEWGHRWLDLKRTGTVDNVMTLIESQKQETWSDYKQWYPLPLTDLQYDHNLVQNAGYQ